MAENYYGSKIPQYLPIFANSQNFEYINSPLDLNDGKIVFSPSKRTSIISRMVYKKLPSLKPIFSEEALYSPIFNNPEAISIFLSNIDAALEIINQSTPWALDVFESIISEICPIAPSRSNKIKCDFGFSDLRVIGTIFTSVRDSKNFIYNTAQSLIHELGHNVVFLFQSGQDLFEDKSTTHIYSGIRKVERPIYGAFHGVVALAYMKVLAKANLEGNNFEFISEMDLNQLYSAYAEGIRQGLSALDSSKLTKLGETILSELACIEKTI